MARSAKILLAAVVVAIATAGLVYFCALKLCAQQSAGTDDLAWLKTEFRLSDREMHQIRQLHEGYLPKCQEMCARIAAKRREIDKTLANSTNASAAVEEQLVELGKLRAQCQAQMLRHFEEVSRAMPPDQGRRYLEEMRKQTLGSHQQLENSMGDGSPAGHVHGQH